MTHRRACVRVRYKRARAMAGQCGLLYIRACFILMLVADAGQPLLQRSVNGSTTSQSVRRLRFLDVLERERYV
jgi:hypothetical protein